MRMGKICFLLDPDKPEVSKVFRAYVMLQSKLDKKFAKECLEYWVGGTKATGDDVRLWLKKLQEKNIGPRIIFPGKISQGVLGYKYADLALVPYLLNWTDSKVFLHNMTGILISIFYKRKKKFGYLVLSKNSTVGSKIGARNLTYFDVLEIVRMFLRKFVDATLYLEGGSGVGKPISVKLVKAVSKLVSKNPSNALIVGGGLKTANDVRRMFSAGADKVVIGTIIEQSTEKKSLDMMLKILRPFEAMWKRGKLNVL